MKCGTQKLYKKYNTEEFLPYYCNLDFIKARTEGWMFFRNETLSTGHQNVPLDIKNIIPQQRLIF